MLIIRNTLLIALVIIATRVLTLCQTARSQTVAQEAAAQEVLKTEREQREAYLQRHIAKIERLMGGHRLSYFPSQTLSSSSKAEMRRSSS